MFILIGGVSRSGKSALAEALQKSFPNAVALHQDDYVLPEKELPFIGGMHDWEVPQSMDWPLWKKVLTNALKQYDTVIAEGILAFLPQEVYRSCDFAIYMQIDFETFLMRRKADLRWGTRPDWYYQHVWDAHFKYGLPPEGKQILRLDGRSSLDENLKKAINKISFPDNS